MDALAKRDVGNELPQHQIQSRAKFPGKMPHRPVGSGADQTQRACLMARGPVHRRLKQQSADSLPAPFCIHEQRCFHMPLRRAVAHPHETRQFVRKIHSGHPSHRSRCKIGTVVGTFAIHRSDRRGAVRLTGPAQQIRNCILVVKTELQKHRSDVRGQNWNPLETKISRVKISTRYSRNIRCYGKADIEAKSPAAVPGAEAA